MAENKPRNFRPTPAADAALKRIIERLALRSPADVTATDAINWALVETDKRMEQQRTEGYGEMTAFPFSYEGGTRCDCPICKMPMHYMFPSPRRDRDEERLVWRLQSCRNPVCKGALQVYDVVTGERHTIKRSETNTFEIDGQTFPTLLAWFKVAGWI